MCVVASRYCLSVIAPDYELVIRDHCDPRGELNGGETFAGDVFALCDDIIDRQGALPLTTMSIRAGVSADKRATWRRVGVIVGYRMFWPRWGEEAGDNFGQRGPDHLCK